MALTEAGPKHAKEQLLDMLVRQTPDHAIVLIALDGRIEHWLGAAERVFGYSAAEVEGQPAAVLFTPDDCQRGLPAFELEQALRSPRAEDDRWHVRKDGTCVWVSGSVAVLRDEKGRAVGYDKVMRDFTDRLHGGALDVRSEGEGKGTEFSVHLPFVQRDALPVAQVVS